MAFLNETGLARLWEHIVAKLGSKVDIEEGKGLSSNDYTTEEKNLLADLNTRVGETDVATQISDALANLDVETVTPDWNQNDETAPDYIKNRTHWKEGEEFTLIDNAKVNLISHDNEWEFNNMQVCQSDWLSEEQFNLPEGAIIHEGETLTVVFNGVTFTGTLEDEGNEVYSIGNPLLANWFYDVSYGYVPEDVPGDDYYFYICRVYNSDKYVFNGNFKIGKFDIGYNNPMTVILGSETYHKIDPKYLPDSIGNFESKIAELEARIAALEQITNDTFLTLNGYQD